MSEGALHALRALIVVVFTALLIRLVGEVMRAPEGKAPVEIAAAPPATDTSAPEVSAAPAAAPAPVMTAATEAPSPAPVPTFELPEGAIPNAAILTFKSRAAYDAFLKRAPTTGLVVTGRMSTLDSLRVAFDDAAKLKDELLHHADDYAQIGANFPVAVPQAPTPEQRQAGGDQPFGEAVLSSIGAGPSIDRSQWGQDVTVAVLDSGVATHPAFRDGQVQHIDLVNDGKPFNGHGTAIASLIAGDTAGAQGVSPAANILDVRIADATGGSDSFQLARGIEAAIEHGAQVINISMGSYGDSPVVAQAVRDALAHGIVVVASVGNEQAATKTWPAAYAGVISVSGVDATGKLAYFSNSGNPTIAAPGVGVPSAYAQDSKPLLAQGDGTSQAAALVSGAAAAIRSAGGDALTVLTSSARQTSAPPSDVGAGMLLLPTRLR